jgi:hypothetical protein
MRRLLGPTTTAVTATATLDSGNHAAHGAATFLVNVTAIGAGDTWTFTLPTSIDAAARTINVGTSAGITAVGLYRIALSADFSVTRMGILRPTTVTATRTVDGGGPATVTYEVYAIYGG